MKIKIVKPLRILLLLMFTNFHANSQSVVNSSGTTLQDNNYIFEYSIGEISITTLYSSTNHITQGLLQPYIKYLNPECEIINTQMQTFPNPIKDKFRIVGQYNWITAYHVYASNGQLIRSQPFYNNHIDLSELPNAVYFIKLFPGCNNNHRILKVVKQ